MEPNNHLSSSEKEAPDGTASVHQQALHKESTTESHDLGPSHNNQPASNDKPDGQGEIAGDHLVQEDTSTGEDTVKSEGTASVAQTEQTQVQFLRLLKYECRAWVKIALRKASAAEIRYIDL
ncbi:uncharacterized protein B0T23DRAFT_306029 [Neurospora hispaniola]|uniref:Uncharacterized protein n=1 Tax=Neurospora hispaniola TaxID=588809 RepID=A0AAJ0IEB5_9PEZI|nr:hypothetical protein B0T23DRAFT_306029 [Neurospora hispaniola]